MGLFTDSELEGIIQDTGGLPITILGGGSSWCQLRSMPAEEVENRFRVGVVNFRAKVVTGILGNVAPGSVATIAGVQYVVHGLDDVEGTGQTSWLVLEKQ